MKPDLPPIPVQDLIDCAAREVRQREHVYPRLVASGKMSRDKMRHEIRCMNEIERVLRDVGSKERLI